MSIIGQCALLLALAALLVLLLSVLSAEEATDLAPAALVLCVRNQAEVVEGTFRDLIGAACRADVRWERILLLDDGSVDETPLILERLARRRPGVEARAISAAEREALASLASPAQVTVLVTLSRWQDGGAIRRVATQLGRLRLDEMAERGNRPPGSEDGPPCCDDAPG